ncbi:hypothetical protein JTE90_009400 [Oedothorax gibbosus]|uniref:Calponin-homology (CH) domain-containing protein n=1 Tax=Oedothorax gibbosus TaxID=931172 RepID=A0AAV6VS78_9ARAC|nr:hypothetical protein JTE90_009400 [Oedothorax gibbosus]
MELYKQRKRKLSGRKTAQSFTVHIPSPEAKPEETPVLELKLFAKPTHISFEKVKVGSTKTYTLLIKNPAPADQLVQLEKFPFDKDFTIDKNEYFVPASGLCIATIVWAPKKPISFRESVLFKTSSGLRVQVLMHCDAYSPKKQKKKHFNQTAIQKTKKMFEKSISEYNFTEGTKENINPPINIQTSNSLASDVFPTPKAKLSLHPIDLESDTLIRRQTYTINNLFRESGIGIKNNAVPPFSLNQARNEVVSNEKKVEPSFNFRNLPCERNKNIISSIIEHDCKEVLNDSLEISPSEPSPDKDSFVDPSSVNAFDPNLTNSSTVDSVKVFDSSAKHFYFGYTPDTSSSNAFRQVPKLDKTEVDLRRKVLNPSEFVLNQWEAKSNTLSSKFNHDKRLTFTAAVTVPSSAPNLIEGYQKSNTFTHIAPANHESSLTSNPNNLNDSLDEPVFAKKQEFEFLVPNVVKANKSAEPAPQSFKLSNFHPDDSYQPETSHLPSLTEELDVVKECHSSIAFEIQSDFPKAFKTPADYKRLLNGKQMQQPKAKSKAILPKKTGRKLVRNLKLSNTLTKSTKKSPDVTKTSKVDQSVQETEVDSSTSDSSIRRTTTIMPQRASLRSYRNLEMYQPNPYASFNAYYDEYWMEKQEAAFTNWLNFILTPTDDFSSSEEVKVNCAEIWIESMKDAAKVTAPTKEDLSFKAYTTAKQLRQLRESAGQLYQSEKLSQVIQKVEREVDIKKLSIRKDRAIHADLGIKKDLLEMLLSYNPLWLRIGLETVYGEIIPLHSNKDVVSLSRFIIHRFLSNPFIIAQHSYTAIKNYYKPGYEDAMQKFTLKKFLLLVFFLDEAKRNHLIHHDPCLFCKSSKYKCSRDLLLTFSREYLSGEGDITKHLRYLGYVVKHEQKPIEEFDYAVRNIAVDLRCGLRLGRVVELLLQDWEISKCLRVNTLNRLSKIHNNEVILKALEKASINADGKIDPRDVVDGNRERTLGLLWQIIFKTQIARHVNLEDLKKENSHLRRSMKLNADFAAFEALQNGDDGTKELNELFNLKLYKENEVIQQLLQWCYNVAAHYGVKVYNFTSSFADGRVLCLLLHHYHPKLLPLDKIKMETSSSYFQMQLEASLDEDTSNGQLTPGLKDKLLKNDKENLDTVFQKFQEIGRIPILSFPLHVPNTIPDEKVMITLVSYINIRLMEISVVIRAARTIWWAYRQYCLRKKQQKLKVQISAACKIQKYWRAYVTHKIKQIEEKAAMVVQQCWKRYAAIKLLEQLKEENKMKMFNKQAIIIQAAYRSYLTRKYLQKRKSAAIVLQKNIRMWLARKRYLIIKKVAVQIQQVYRAKVLGRSNRFQYLKTKQLVTHCQAVVRGYLVRNKLKRQNSSAVTIQSQFRCYLQRSKFLKEKAACMIIQSHFRGFICRKLYLKKKNAVRVLQSHLKATLMARKARNSYLKALKSIITVQALVRGWLVRKNIIKLNCSAVKIQAMYRSFMCRKLYLKKQHSAIILQRQIRVYFQKKAEERKKNNAAITIQSCFKGYIAKGKFVNMKSASVCIQAHFRRYLLQKWFLKQKSAALLLQKYFRSYLIAKSIRESYIQKRKSVVMVQALVRGWLVRKYVQRLNESATKLQAAYRSHLCRKQFLEKKRSVTLIQICVRAYLHKKAIERRNNAAATIIQSAFRGYVERTRFKKQRSACVLIQSSFRRYICRKKYLKQKQAAKVIQSKYRALKTGTKERNYYLQYRKNVILVQAAIKGWLLRKQMNKLHISATVIQSVYRSSVCRKIFLKKKQSAIIIQRCVKSYLSKKAIKRRNNAAATIIQSTFRGYLERSRFRRQKSACVLIQSCVRKHACRKRYLKQKESAKVIQSQYRAFSIGKKDRSSFLEYRKKLILVQAVTKGWLLRKHLRKQHRSATLIQSVYRSYVCQKNYQKKKQSAIIIQRCVRSYLCKKAIERKNNAAATIIQATYKGYVVRKAFKTKKSACIVIQSCIREYLCRKAYLRKKNAAITIQNQYRAFKIGTKTRNSYLKDRKCIISAQATVKCWLVRKYIRKLHRSAIVIQSIYRSYICKKSYQKKKESAIVLQKCVRAYLHKKAIEKRNNTAATLIQSAFRGYVEKSRFKRRKSACVLIQSHFRRHICKNRYLEQKQAAMVIQSRYRAFRIGTKERNNFLEYRRNVILVQAIAKGWLIRKEVAKLHRSATVIQSMYRSYACRKSYLIKKQSAIIVQRCVRSYLCKKATERENNAAAAVIQATFRGYVERKAFKRQRSACIAIQSYMRKYICKKQYLRKKKAAITIQSRYRALRIGRNTRECFLKDKERIISAQSIVRGWLIRKQIQNQNKHATLIQTVFRSYILRIKYLEKKHSVIAIQRCFRFYLHKKAIERRNHAAVIIQSHCRRRIQQLKFQKLKSATVIIQSYARKHLCRTRYLAQKSAAIAIQRYFRAVVLGKSVRNSYLSYRKSVITAQAVVRGKLTRKHLSKLDSSATKIQSVFRSYVCKKLYTKQKHSALILQHHIRDYLQRKAYERKRNLAATIIQAAYRGYVKRSTFNKQKIACIVIQSYYRRHICQEKFASQKWAASVVQARFRAILIGRMTKKAYLYDRKCIILVQSLVRRWIVNSKIQLLQYSASKIQTTYRTYVCRKQYLKKKHSIHTIQRYFRSYLHAKRIHNQYMAIRQSTICIQRTWRAYRAKCEFLRRENAAIQLQACVRMVLARKKFLLLVQSAKVIQRFYLAYRTRQKELQEKVQCCTKIQACFRGYLVRKSIKKQAQAAVVIQQSFRNWAKRKALSEALKKDPQYLWYSHLRASIVIFQRKARVFVQRRMNAVLLIQYRVRMWLKRRQYAALKIQALWRGYAVRRSIQNQKLVEIRRNVHKVYDERKQLAHRTLSALTELQGTNLRNILYALKNLDVCTRLSSTCCERLQESGGLTKLIHLLDSCNRSVPHKEIIKLCTNILLNLAKHNKTVGAVWREPDSLNVFLKLMKIYCKDKVDLIFSKCCSLFWIFHQDSLKAQILKENAVFMGEIRKFHSYWKQKKLKSDSTIIKRISNSRPSLVIDPDWLLGQHRMREFDDPYIAIASLVHSLDLL